MEEATNSTSLHSSSDSETDSSEGSEELNEHITEEEWQELSEELENMKDIRILCGGATGVGKSTLLNGLMGSNVNGSTPSEESSLTSFKVGNSLQAGTGQVSEITYSKNDINVTLWDTPGLEGRRDVDEGYLQEIKEKCATFDLFLYCINSTDTRATELFDEKSSLLKFTKIFGKELWKKAVIVLTKANAIEADLIEENECDSDVNIEEEFIKKMHEWDARIRCELRKTLFISKKIARKVPILPAGTSISPHLPGYQFWLSKIFDNVCDRMKYEARMAYIRMNADRLREEKDVNVNSISEQTLEDQPIITFDNFKTKTAIASTAVGTTGGIIGAATGATIGALAIGAVSFGIFAGVGLVVGGAIGATVGTSSAIATSLAIKQYKKRKHKKNKDAKK